MKAIYINEGQYSMLMESGLLVTKLPGALYRGRVAVVVRNDAGEFWLRAAAKVESDYGEDGEHNLILTSPVNLKITKLLSPKGVSASELAEFEFWLENTLRWEE